MLLKKTLICVSICSALLLSACSNGTDEDGNTDIATDLANGGSNPSQSAKDESYIVDFSDGETEFLLLNTGTPGTDKNASMEIVDLDGAKALKLIAPNGGVLRIGIDINSLLGTRVSDLRTAVFEIYTEYPDGNFGAVEGYITAYDKTLTEVASNVWTVYLASRNPNEATLKLDTGSNIEVLEISRTIDNAYDRGETPAIIYIKSVSFYDAENKAIPLDTSAVWNAIEDYGKAPAMLTVKPDPNSFFDEGGGKYRYSIAHLIGQYSNLTITYTPAENTGDLEFIVKDPDNGYWAQCGVDSVTQDGDKCVAVISAESIEKKFPGAISRASQTSERSVVITNWSADTTIDEIVIEGATGLLIDVTDFVDEGGGKYRYGIADKISPYSEIKILYTPDEYEGGNNLEFIVKDPDNGYWLQSAADVIDEFGNGKQYMATIIASNIEQKSVGTFERAGGTDEHSVVITNWSDSTVIDEILIINPKQ